MADTPQQQPVVNDVSIPTIEKHASAMAQKEDVNPQPQDDTLVSTNGTTIAPNATAAQNIADATATAPQEQAVADNTTEPETNPEEKTTTGPASSYEASDSLPDLSEKLTTEMTNDMQTPRIYDTKEYVVPIHDTMHSHGTMGKIIAAVVSVVVVLAVVIGIAYAVI
jgi:hypothetical protein